MNNDVNPFGSPNQQPGTQPSSTPNPFGSAPSQPVQPTTQLATPQAPTMGVAASQPVAGLTGDSSVAGSASATSTNQAGSTVNSSSSSNPFGAPVGGGFPTSGGSAPVSPFNSFPADTTTPITTNPSLKPKRSKAPLMALGIGLVLIIAAIVAVVIYFMTSNVTADDYAEAVSKIESIDKELSESIDDSSLSNISSIGDMDADSMNQIVDDAKKELDDTKSKLEELGKLKAVAHDEDAKKLYDNLISDFDNLSNTYSSVMDKAKAIMPVAQKIYSAISSIGSISYSNYSSIDYGSIADAYRDVATAAKGAETDDEELRDILDQIADAYSQMADYIEAVAAGDLSAEAPDMSSMDDLSDRMNEVMSTDDMVDAASKVSDSYQALYKYLQDKSSDSSK